MVLPPLDQGCSGCCNCFSRASLIIDAMFTLRRTWPRPAKDWSVFEDGRPIGCIYQDDTAPLPDPPWFWSLNGEAKTYQIGLTASGRAATFHDAKVEFRGAYERWLSWRALG
jgi:hypothetical protein